MQRTIQYSSAKPIGADSEAMLYHYHIPIYSDCSKNSGIVYKLFRLTMDGNEIPILHKEDLEANDFRRDGMYHVVHRRSNDIVAYYK